MKSTPFHSIGGLFLLCFSLATAGIVSAQDFLGPASLALTENGKTLVVAEIQTQQLRAIPADLSGEGKTVNIGATPRALLAGTQPGRVFVAAGQVDGFVAEVDLAGGKVLNKVQTGHTPTAMALSESGQKLFVANRFSADIAVIDLNNWQVTGKINVLREPVACTIAAGKLWVVNHLPVGPADTGDISSEISVIDPNTMKKVDDVILPNGSTASIGLAASPDGKYLYVSHILARYQVPTTQLERGWMNTNALSVIDAEAVDLINTVLMDEPHLGAANPYKMAATDDGKHLVVLIEGTHEFLVIEREALHERLELAAKGESHSPAVKKPSDVPMDLAFLSGIRERYRLPGLRPYGLALQENQLWISLHFSDTIVSLNLEQPQNQQKSVLNDQVKLTTAQQGEQLFHDATFCFQQWQSCATCHPSDARVDALNWDLLNDGIGNPKQTKSMLLSHSTPPVMVSGVRGDATVAVRAGIRHIFFRQPDEELAAPMDVYLSELTPVPSPELVNGELSEAAERGKKIFSEAGCAFCHSGELYTNLKSYDVGTGGIRGGDEPLDTPTLVEVWRTAPYLKDGRASTIEEVLTKYNKEDKHGKTSHLSKEQISDLAIYVRSL